MQCSVWMLRWGERVGLEGGKGGGGLDVEVLCRNFFGSQAGAGECLGVSMRERERVCVCGVWKEVGR